MPSSKIEAKEKSKDIGEKELEMKSQDKEENKDMNVLDKKEGADKEKFQPMQSKKTTMYLIIGIAVILIIALLYFFRSSYLAAIVNGQPIWKFSLNNKLEETYGELILDQMILETVIMQEAKNQNVSISTETIDTELQLIEAQVVAQGSTLETALASEGLTIDGLRKQIELQKIAEEIAGSNISVSDEEINTYIEENAENIPEDLSGEELKLQVGEQLTEQKKNEAIQVWVSTLQADAKINNFVKEVTE